MAMVTSGARRADEVPPSTFVATDTETETAAELATPNALRLARVGACADLLHLHSMPTAAHCVALCPLCMHFVHAGWRMQELEQEQSKP